MTLATLTGRLMAFVSCVTAQASGGGEYCSPGGHRPVLLHPRPAVAARPWARPPRARDARRPPGQAPLCLTLTYLLQRLLDSNVCSLRFQAKKAKQAEIDRKRAEVRKRMEEASKAKKAKKGFMTPDRKKKLRVSV